LTNDQLAALVGYDMKQIAKSIETFVDAGLLERTQNPMHAARMYSLVLEGPQGQGLRALLAIASTREGRREIVELLDSRHLKPPLDILENKRKRNAVA
jgi:DNA-binding MarR family transcriptional regulator